MKAIVARDALLAYPYNSLPFNVETDASEYQLGAVIKQNGRHIAYYSRIRIIGRGSTSLGVRTGATLNGNEAIPLHEEDDLVTGHMLHQACECDFVRYLETATQPPSEEELPELKRYQGWVVKTDQHLGGILFQLIDY
ncbi:hypothetical protein IV203_020944 [Nitzschia inconspicua]|uniref:Reverse transcriptase/retrotransposon-derived protein RNase H-like domain-containing protein n=1 Tax=Nitzschia inconspicua TaxID=303405 RepID=A0A9K3KGQ7_9STRA|nr:hypothetical protein IV203_020944 [Nitzschia inconspicua]